MSSYAVAYKIPVNSSNTHNCSKTSNSSSGKTLTTNACSNWAFSRSICFRKMSTSPSANSSLSCTSTSCALVLLCSFLSSYNNIDNVTSCHIILLFVILQTDTHHLFSCVNLELVLFLSQWRTEEL